MTSGLQPDRYLRTSVPGLGDTIFRSAAWRAACASAWAGKVAVRSVCLGDPAATRLTIDPGTRSQAIALMGYRTQWRHGLLPVRVLALNQSTLAKLDQTWIEKNGFFELDDSQFEERFEDLLDALEDTQDWDELWLPGLSEYCATVASRCARQHGLGVRTELEQPNYQVDFDQLRTSHNGNFLDSVSSNTRQQLRRSLRLAQSALGSVTLSQASSVEEALHWFDLTAPLHRSRWGHADPLSGSGFDNPAFVAFHRELITRGFSQGHIQYLRLNCGAIPVAYLYNLVSGSTTEFYLSGIDYRALPADGRPGMLAHWYAIEHNQRLGQKTYDFLAGEARYKRSLANQHGQTIWLVLQRPRLKLRLEEVARTIKRSLGGQTGGEASR